MQQDDDKIISTAEAGRKGGLRTAEIHGKQFYEEIGRKGGLKTAEKHGREFFESIGRKGGKTVSFGDGGKNHMSQIGRKGGLARGQ